MELKRPKSLSPPPDYDAHSLRILNPQGHITVTENSHSSDVVYRRVSNGLNCPGRTRIHLQTVQNSPSCLKALEFPDDASQAITEFVCLEAVSLPTINLRPLTTYAKKTRLMNW